MNTKSTIEWLENMAFDAELNGHHFTIDADEKVGGKNRGPRPKGLMLSALAGCTGMDVVSILKKMKVTNYKLKIDVEAEQTNEHPKVYHTIYVIYNFMGESLPTEKIKRAIELSQTRYCGVSKMLGKIAKIKTKIKINLEEIK